MVSTFTANIQLEEPARGDDVGTWDTPVNANMTLLDLVAGGIVTQSLNNSNIVLTSAQFQSKGITFNSTLTGSVTITFPTSFKKSYEVYNTCTGSSAFTITLQTTASGGEVVGCPPGEWFEVVNDGTNIRYKNFGRVGSYWDYAGSSVPAWVSLCTKAPYLNCDGSTFSATTYPALALVLGSTTLPDTKGRVRMALDQSAGRVSSGTAGFSPNTVGAGGGSQNMQQHNHSVTDPGHLHSHGTSGLNFNGNATGFPNTGANLAYGSDGNTASATTGISIQNTGTGGSQNMQPTYVGGLTLIRAG